METAKCGAEYPGDFRDDPFYGRTCQLPARHDRLPPGHEDYARNHQIVMTATWETGSAAAGNSHPRTLEWK